MNSRVFYFHLFRFQDLKKANFMHNQVLFYIIRVRGQEWEFSRKRKFKFKKKVKNKKQNKAKKQNNKKPNKNMRKVRKIFTLLENGRSDYCTH